MKILVVCLGNICRSPLAEGIFRKEIQANNLPWEVDSAGTSGWHNGELPDRRSIITAKENGIDITDQRSRLLVKNDLKIYDHVLAMDSSNYNNIRALSESETEKEKVSLILNYAYPHQNKNVPDPYYEGGFQSVYEMLEIAIQKFIEKHG